MYLYDEGVRYTCSLERSDHGAIHITMSHLKENSLLYLLPDLVLFFERFLNKKFAWVDFKRRMYDSSNPYVETLDNCLLMIWASERSNGVPRYLNKDVVRLICEMALKSAVNNKQQEEDDESNDSWERPDSPPRMRSPFGSPRRSRSPIGRSRSPARMFRYRDISR